MTLGDVDADGGLEVVFGTSAGGVHVLRGATGHDVAGFPFRTRGRIMAPVLLVPLVAEAPGLHLVVQSYDGHLYAIHGATGAPCLDCPDEGSRMLLAMLVRCPRVPRLPILAAPLEGSEQKGLLQGYTDTVGTRHAARCALLQALCCA